MSARNVKIEIAGTSIGGSSYAHRILESLLVAGKGGKVEVVISRGKDQDKVTYSVVKSISYLERLLSMHGSQTTSLPVSVLKEY